MIVSYLRSRGALDFFQLLKLGLGAVVAVEGIAATDQAIARRGGAIAEGAADELGREHPLRERVGENVRIAEHDPANADNVGPAVAHDVLPHMGQIFLKIAVAGPYDRQLRAD